MVLSLHVTVGLGLSPLQSALSGIQTGVVGLIELGIPFVRSGKQDTYLECSPKVFPAFFVTICLVSLARLEWSSECPEVSRLISDSRLTERRKYSNS